MSVQRSNNKRGGRGFFSSLRRAWRAAGAGQSIKDTLPDGDLPRIREQIDACLSLRGGEVSARARAADLGHTYLELKPEGRARFLKLLADEYGCDDERLTSALKAMQGAMTSANRHGAELELRAALEPRRVTLLRQFNALPQGVKFLVEMRAELLPLARQDAGYRPLETDLRELLASWFDIGFLNLRRITWEASAALLEKLIDYEAVHQIRSWGDLKDRLDSDRRCFAFFHPRMPDEPLIFVEVALVQGLAGNIHDLLDEAAPSLEASAADTAVFYSISNAQAGLAGVSFGNFLIKQVVSELAREFPNLKTFSTLSPVPGFSRWLQTNLDDSGSAISFADDESRLLQGQGEGETAAAALRSLIAGGEWPRDEALADLLQPILMRLCAEYLVKAKRGRTALDSVAHFHLTNGARLERVNWGANMSEDGLAQSFGLMVNYLYKLSDIDKNHENYALNGKIAAAPAVRRLAAG